MKICQLVQDLLGGSYIDLPGHTLAGESVFCEIRK
jgi:hypothetical protein